MRKVYKTTYTVTVLSEDHPPSEGMNLRDVLTEYETGGWSGSISGYSAVELSGREAAQELRSQASDPGFFDLDDDGSDLN